MADDDEKNEVAVKGGGYRDVSIDCETLSLDPHAVVVSIGAVAFNQAGLGASLRLVLNRNQQEHSMGRAVDTATLRWWKEHMDGGAGKVFAENGMAVSAALFELSRFVQAMPGCRIWAKGGKDFTWLETLYQDMGNVVPWHYRAATDYRALIACTETNVVSGLDYDALVLMEKGGGRIVHEALNDAQFQAHFLRGLLTLKGYWKLSR